MKTATLMLAVFIWVLVGCSNQSADEHGHSHDHPESLTYTLYSDSLELFVEFNPLVVGSTTDFAAHFTVLGNSFKPLLVGKVTVSLIVGNSGIRNSLDSSSTPGIYKLSLTPKVPGKGRLVFDIQTSGFSNQIVIPDVEVFANSKDAEAHHKQNDAPGELAFLKEQAWKVEFANAPVTRSVFSEIIKTSGRILPAPGDEKVVTAGASGIVRFIDDHVIVGASVNTNTIIFSISGGNMAENNVDAHYQNAKVNLDRAKADYERNSVLAADRIVSESELLQSKNAFELAQSAFKAISKNQTGSGQSVSAPMTGFIRNVMVNDGQFVEAGTPLAVISLNKRLLLQADLSQKYFHKIPGISSANFKVLGSSEVYDTRNLNANVVAFAKATEKNSMQLPITFQIMNPGTLISGSIVEIFLRSNPIPNSLLVPYSSLLEEQGNLYVYVQSGGESFQKREIQIGGNDGKQVQVLSGLQEGERVVTKGALHIKLATASGQLPAHGHEH